MEAESHYEATLQWGKLLAPFCCIVAKMPSHCESVLTASGGHWHYFYTWDFAYTLNRELLKVQCLTVQKLKIRFFDTHFENICFRLWEKKYGEIT